IRAWRKELLDGGLGEVTVAKCYRFLRAVLNTAVDDELIRGNPCRIEGAGSETSPEHLVASPAQVQVLMAALPASGGGRSCSWRCRSASGGAR
ncbi:MAG: hypothetical protein ACRDQD_23990, partial [Nocardioidaceae bacterium]